MNTAHPELAAWPAVAALVLLSAALVLSLARLIRGPSLPDRVVALDMILTVAVGILAAWSMVAGESAILDAGIVTALVAFLGTVAFAGYVQKGSRR